jgi:hypothetical protein
VNGFGLWRRPKAVACGLVILTGLEFALFATRLVKVAPWEEVFWASSVVENLRKDLESGRIWNPALVAGTPTSRVVPELQLVCAGLRYLEGYEPFYFQHQRDFFRALSPLSVERPEGMALSIDRIRQPLLDLAGVRYLLLREDPAPYLPWTRLGTVGAPYGSFSIYVNPGALPRAFVVPEALPAPWDDSSRRALVGIDPRRQVVLDRDVLPSGQRQPFTPARIVRETASTVEVEVELAAAGYLVLADLWMPGWEAWDNGSRVDVLRANHALRAVPLPAGKHRVRWVYWPPWFRTGLLISLAGWTLLILWMLVPSKGVHASFQTRPSNLTTAVGRRVPYQSTTEPSSAS